MQSIVCDWLVIVLASIRTRVRGTRRRSTFAASVLVAVLQCRMPPFVYRCPKTGLNVQGWVADDPTEGEGETYYSVTCTICTQMHLVDPKTARVLGADIDWRGLKRRKASRQSKAVESQAST